MSTIFRCWGWPTKSLHPTALSHGVIEATDRQIDVLVYELYGLTEEEIGVVEG